MTDPKTDPRKESATLLAGAPAERSHLVSIGAPLELAAHNKALDALKVAQDG